MANIVASIGKGNTSTLKARLSGGQEIKAQSLAIGPPSTLSDMKDIDFTLLEQGSVLIYDETNQVWLAKPTMDDGTYIEGGKY